MGFVSPFYDHLILEGHFITRKSKQKMDEKNTKLPAADGAASPDDGSNKPLSLGHQAFDVFKDVLIGDLIKENRKLRIENEKLAPVDETLNSTLTVLVAGKEYTSDIINGDRDGRKVCFYFDDIETIPLSYLFVGSFGSEEEPSAPAPPAGPRLVVTLGSIELGALNIESGTQRGRVEAMRNNFAERDKGGHLFYIWLKPRVVVGGRLTNISEEDLSDNFHSFNQLASARLTTGFPFRIRNEENITFTMKFVKLYMTPEFEETLDVLSPHVSVAPDTLVLPELVEDVLEDDGTFSETLGGKQNSQIREPQAPCSPRKARDRRRELSG